MRRSSLLLFAFIAAASLAACGRSETEDDEYDFDLDAQAPAVVDAGSEGDVSLDAPADGERGVDAANDAREDVAEDQSVDAPPDSVAHVANDVTEANDAADEDAPEDAAVDVAQDAPRDAMTDAPRDAPVDAPPDVVGPTDASSPDAGVVAVCADCAQKYCARQLADCFDDAACTAGAACVIDRCFGQGEPDFGCATRCFQGNLAATVRALGALRCVNSRCGTACARVIGGGF